jgi:hypothetical protein
MCFLWGTGKPVELMRLSWVLNRRQDDVQKTIAEQEIASRVVSTVSFGSRLHLRSKTIYLFGREKRGGSSLQVIMPIQAWWWKVSLQSEDQRVLFHPHTRSPRKQQDCIEYEMGIYFCVLLSFETFFSPINVKQVWDASVIAYIVGFHAVTVIVRLQSKLEWLGKFLVELSIMKCHEYAFSAFVSFRCEGDINVRGVLK